jgi:hypothetical protein
MASKKKAATPKKPTLPAMVQRRLMFDITPTGLVRETHRGAWRKLRRDRIKTGNLACDLCGALEDIGDHLHLHEVYTFPNPETVRLDATRFLCRLCHDTIHYDRTHTFAQQPWRDECAAHYCKLNGVTAETFEEDRRAAMTATSHVSLFYGSRANRAERPRLDYGSLTELAAASAIRKAEWAKSGRSPPGWADYDIEPYSYTRGGTPIGFGFGGAYDPYSG